MAGRLLDADGRLRDAGRLRRAALQSLAQCEGATIPGLDGHAPFAPEALTPREREVARLAVAGFGSREIAAELRITVRTVDDHLQRIYAKLGVHNRRELRTNFRGAI